jgi:cell division protein FtsB
LRKKKQKKKKRSELRKFVYPAIVVVLMAVCAYLLLPGFRELDSVRARVGELERVSDEKKAANEILEKEIASMSTSEGIERAARQHLHVAKSDELIVRFGSAEAKEQTER